jgi:hypothetical protein
MGLAGHFRESALVSKKIQYGLFRRGLTKSFYDF